MPSDLNGRHRHTYETIFRHPVAHNLEWHDVRSLLAAVGDVTEGHNGALQVARNGHTEVFHAPKHKDVATAEHVLALRHFLERSAAPAAATAVPPGTNLLVVIDHHEAKVYRAEMSGAVPQQLVPYDPHGFRRHLHSQAEETDGHRKPERKSYYEAIAKTLRGAERVLIFGHGTGASSAMEQLLIDLKHNHHDVAACVVGTVVIDEHHRTDEQLLAQAREFFAAKAGDTAPGHE
jgi:hypothetical protein